MATLMLQLAFIWEMSVELRARWHQAVLKQRNWGNSGKSFTGGDMDQTAKYIEMMKIYELLFAYTHALDHTEPLDFANCFSPDGMLGHGNHSIRGREKLRDHAEVHRAIPTRHLSASPVYRIADDGMSAKGQSTVVVTVATRRGYKIFFSGHFDDELTKVDGTWLLNRRWAVDSRLPGEPDFSVGPADPDVAELLQQVYDSFHRLGRKTA